MRPLQLSWILVAFGGLVACGESSGDVDGTALSANKGGRPGAYKGPRELSNRQFHPAQGEGATVGSLRAPIVKGTRSFGRLVPCKSDGIVFKDEEGSGADRLMTRGTRTRLLRLAKLVETEWPGLRLRVTEAWDEENEHGARSVHYEGRAVDLTVSDMDRGKLGRLGGLAAEAGFEWVYYESSHIHASTKRD